jgi:Kef-type K+ transport system membrane component KefB
MITTLILLYLLLIIIASLWASKKTGIADVLFYLIGGLLAVNLHLLSPESATIETFAFIGTIFLFFYLGLEENLESFAAGIKKGWKIAVTGVILPFLGVYFTQYALSHNTITSIVFAMALAPTSIGIAFLTLNTLSFSAKFKLQPIIVAAALTDDVISLILWGVLGGILVSLGTSTVEITLQSITQLAIKPVSNFLYFSLAMVLITLLSKIKTKRNFGHQDVNTAIIMMVFLAFLGSFIAEFFGTSIALGAYFVGLIINKEHFIIDHSPNHELFHQAIEKLRFMTLYFFAPIFFISIGLHMEIKSFSLFMEIFSHAFILAVVLFVTQLVAASFTAHYINNLPWRSAILIGVAMQGRAEVTFLVAIAAFSMQLITSSDLLLISVIAFILNLSVPFLLKYAAHEHEKRDQAVM